ncbi:MAG: glycosyltransferase [Aliifodinibius sp.]|nr:glycosyltransferase family 4 protein [Fodinibius sp.]NIV14822.1 glycosyltransferase [Fodinibius sp.]NIY28701.1 glycosyltransferase [Fodinibius sp.]
MKKQVLMIAYTNYRLDPRIRREAETLAATSEYAVRFLAPKQQHRKKTFQFDGVTVEELNISKYFGGRKVGYLISYLHFFVLAFLNCTKKFLQREIEIIHVHNMPNFLVFAGVIPRWFGKKLILDIHDTVPEHYAGKFETPASKLLHGIFCLEERISCALAHRIICVNHVQRDVLVNRGIPGEKITISMNVPDHMKFHHQKMTREANGEDFKMVYHGTLEKRLGIDLVIRVMAELADEIPGLQFHILGVGSHAYLEELLQLRGDLHLEERVFCNFNPVPVDQVPEFLMKMDLGVVPNRKNIATELMLPVKMLEYISLGIPVVASRLKTIEYYFAEDMVSYFEPENVSSMADAILKLYKDQIKRERQAIHATTFLEKYGWEKHQLDLMKLYDHLCSPQKEMA